MENILAPMLMPHYLGQEKTFFIFTIDELCCAMFFAFVASSAGIPYLTVSTVVGFATVIPLRLFKRGRSWRVFLRWAYWNFPFKMLFIRLAPKGNKRLWKA